MMFHVNTNQNSWRDMFQNRLLIGMIDISLHYPSNFSQWIIK